MASISYNIYIDLIYFYLLFGSVFGVYKKQSSFWILLNKLTFHMSYPLVLVQ